MGARNLEVFNGRKKRQADDEDNFELSMLIHFRWHNTYSETLELEISKSVVCFRFV